MSKLKFSDGVTIDTSGPLRPIHMVDGWYVTGNGYLIPVKDEEEAYEVWTRKFNAADIREGQVYELTQWKTRFRVKNVFEGKVDRIASMEFISDDKNSDRSWSCGSMLMDVRKGALRLIV